MFHKPMALEDKDRPLVTVTQTAPCEGAVGPSTSPDADVAQLKERDSKRYQFIAEHGRGGLGRVMRTRDKDLGREVAIKEILNPGGLSEARFVREAMITARLEHPGIVPVHDAGRWPDGTPFYSMKLVSGKPLKELIQSAKTIPARLGLVPHVIAVAEAIAYAHDRHIIHRDLKPSNIIVGDFGETIVIDWGLAKDMRSSEPAPEFLGPYRHSGHPDLTQLGSVVGTPAYMPPEQARGEEVDERADVYSLGAVIYHVLAGVPPFRGGDTAKILATVISEAPTPLESLAPDVPLDLAAIVTKAMQRDPSERYSNAKALAEDLVRFQTGHLVSAHHYTASTILRRWAAKHRHAVVVAGALLSVLAVSSVVSIRRILKERLAATQAQSAAEARANDLLLVQARTQLRQDPTAAIGWLAKFASAGKDMALARDIAADAESRGVARYVLRGKHRQVTGIAFGRDMRVFTSNADSTVASWVPSERRHSVVASKIFDASKIVTAPEKNRIAYEDGKGNIVVADYDGTIQATLSGHSGAVLAMEFSPDAAWLLTADWHSVYRLWHLSTPSRPIWERSDVMMATFYGSDHLLTIDSKDASKDGTWVVNLRSLVDTDGPPKTLQTGHSGTVISLAVSTGWSLAVYSTAEGTVGVIDIARWQVAEVGHVDGLANTAISSDGMYVAAGTRQGQAKLWEVAKGSLLASYQHAAPIISIAFSAHRLITTAEDGVTTIVDADGGSTLQLLAGAPTLIPSAVAQDGRWLAVGAGDDVRIWSLTSQRPRRAVLHRVASFNSLFSDEHTVISDGTDGRVVAWDIASGTQRELAAHHDLVFGLAASADRSTLAWASHDGTASILSQDQAHVVMLRGHHGAVMGVAMTSDGALVATAGVDHSVRFWEKNGTPRGLVSSFDDQVTRIRFSSDGSWLAALSRDGRVTAIQIKSLSPEVFEPSATRFVAQTWVPKTHLLILGTDDGRVETWSPETGVVTELWRHDGSVKFVATTSDGSWISSAGSDGSVIVANLSNGKRERFQTIDTKPHHLAIAASGPTLIATCEDGSVRLWNLSDGSASLLRSGDNSAYASSLSPSETTLATSVDEGAVTIWSLNRLEFIPVDAQAFRSWLAQTTISVY
jgi:WD40 repeat protein